MCSICKTVFIECKSLTGKPGDHLENEGYLYYILHVFAAFR